MFQDGISGWLCEEMSGEGLSLDQMDVSGGLQSHIITTLMITDAYCDNNFSCVLLIAWFYIKLEYIPGNTPLHLAARAGKTTAVATLLHQGATASMKVNWMILMFIYRDADDATPIEEMLMILMA